MACARCGSGIYKAEEFVCLNKTWHKCCFTCYQCNKRLDKDVAKIFQGELFCDYCYTSVIEKLFEVLSTPSFIKPCKAVSTPSCCVSNNLIQNFKEGDICLKQLKDKCKTKEYCFPAQKKNFPKSTQSCSCISNNVENEYCFLFPIPREVANYYNRSHMRSNTCKNPVPCCPQQQCPACSCRKTCYSEPKCPPKNRCCCSSCLPRCGKSQPKKCCCPKAPKPCAPVFINPCCPPLEPGCCDPCSTPPSCSAPCRSPPPCPISECCQKTTCAPKCPRKVCFGGPCCQNKCPPTSCCPAEKCLPTKCYPVSNCTPIKYCPPRMDGCCMKQCCEVPRCSGKSPCSCRPQKYCVCGNQNPCNCKMSQIRAQCTACCNRCGQKVYAAEKVVVSSGAYHTSCFTCYCCNKCLDVKNVYEGCGEIYCKHCYNHFFGIQYYGFGGPNC